MTRQEIEKRLNECHSSINTLEANLRKTDYIGVKIAEGAATKTEYAGKRAERQAWREQINAAKEEIARLEALEPDTEERLTEE